ncbi:uncharacterized protein LOC141880195 [Acropora palmata]|uniref:uncharacterized protein LOC141880195 n=1 Tax=Acropora palmata TaxID=6131 RepID=UPI003D9FCA04
MKQMLRLCFVCHEEDLNLVKASCCRNYHHPDCLERWMSTLIKSSNKCPMCRRKYKKPHAEAQAADANFMIRIAGLCEEQHPVVSNSKSCIACIYFNKGLNPIQQHEFAFAIQCIFTCRTVNGDHENCDHCQRLIEKVYKYL